MRPGGAASGSFYGFDGPSLLRREGNREGVTGGNRRSAAGTRRAVPIFARTRSPSGSGRQPYGAMTRQRRVIWRIINH